MSLVHRTPESLDALIEEMLVIDDATSTSEVWVLTGREPRKIGHPVRSEVAELEFRLQTASLEIEHVASGRRWAV